MSQGQNLRVTVTRVSEHPPGEFNGKKAWKVDTQEAGVIQIVKPADQPKPTVNETVYGTLYPPKGDYPPSLYPRQGGGGRRSGKSPEEIRSIERQVALKSAVELVINDKAALGEIAGLTEEFYRLIAGAGGDA